MGTPQGPAKPWEGDPTQLRRRPSGEPAPLPKEPLAGLGWLWVISLAVVLGIIAIALAEPELFLGQESWWSAVNDPVTDWFIAQRGEGLTDLALTIDVLRSDWFLALLRWGTVVVLIVTARWRHLYAFIIVVLGTELLVGVLAQLLARPGPTGIEILIETPDFAAPSLSGAAVAVTLVAMTYALIVPGIWRKRTLYAATVVIVIFGLARIYLGAEHLTDIASGEIIGVGIAVLAFRVITPDAVFPVSYKKRKTAHLELSAARTAAIIAAVRDQLGLTVASVELFGLEGSGGSTPLRIGLADGTYVFGKIYAKNHLRSDRWYKLGRSILYGALEDEAPFRTVRRLAQHEDHVMRLMHDAGVPIPEPVGIVELTPGREYMLVTSFLDGVRELSDADVDESTVDSAMWSVSKMWDRGLAHRDIKPANVLVDAGGVHIIDHAFGEIRPSPWRQAVDLANMMLALSVHLPTSTIYEIARHHFTDEELAEAFAATGGVTIPGELRARLGELDNDPLEEFRSLAPERPRIRIQRWTRRRVLGLCLMLAAVAAAIWMAVANQTIVTGLL